jgi:phage tail-like protein
VRASAEGMVARYSLAAGLPPSFFGSDFTGEFVAAFDDVLAPVFAVLDNLDAYLDPALAPDDFLPWLAGWMGLAVDERWKPARVREFLAGAVELFRWAGTRQGIAGAVHAHTGVEPAIEESGGVAWSARPGAAYTGERTPRLVVRVVTDDPKLDPATVDRVVTGAKPAHLPHRVEVVFRPAG